jgi:predicted nucleic-acid-binding Zn-ribbon protein
MAFTKCPNCGGSRLYRSAQNTPANGLFGPNLLPKLSPGRFRVVVCKDCGLTSLFASVVDIEGLSAPEWEPMVDGISARPLGLAEP